MDKRWVKYDDESDAVCDHVSGNLQLREDGAIKDIEIGVESIDRKSYQVHVSALVRYEDLEIPEESGTLVRIKRNVCPKCNKIMGNYFESIVQIRPSNRRFSDEEREDVLRRATEYVEGIGKHSKEAFIAKVTQTHGGYDPHRRSPWERPSPASSPLFMGRNIRNRPHCMAGRMDRTSIASRTWCAFLPIGSGILSS